MLSEQICPSSAQNCASLSPRLGCPFPAVRKREWERSSHGDSSGIPFNRAGAPHSADFGRIPVEQKSAVRGKEKDEGGDRKRPEEGQPQGRYGQNVAHLCSKHTGRNR